MSCQRWSSSILQYENERELELEACHLSTKKSRLPWDEQRRIQHVYLGPSFPGSAHVGVEMYQKECCCLAKEDQEKQKGLNEGKVELYQF